MQRPPRARGLLSICEGQVLRGQAHQIQQRYEELAKEANARGDVTLYHRYLQQAEHYIRIQKDENEAASWSPRNR